MAWKECTVMSLRYEFVKLATKQDANISELCRRYTISRATAYKWINRYTKNGLSGLYDQSKRPKKLRDITDKKMENEVCSIRNEHSSWGGRKIKRRLEDKRKKGEFKKNSYIKIPAASTITEILRRNGLLYECNDNAPKKKIIRFEYPKPNDLWQMDFKGDVHLGDKTTSYPLTVLDDYSRFNLCLQSCKNIQRTTVVPHLRNAFRKYGLPKAMLMDNGKPWSDGKDVLTQMTIWFLRLGIHIIHGRAYHPQTQGKEERFHKTLKTELLNGRIYHDYNELQKAFDMWRPIYNYERPHEAKKLDTPGDHYSASRVCYPEQLPEIQYDEGEIVRKVRGIGYFTYKGISWYLSEALIGEQIALRPTKKDGFWMVCYGSFAVGLLDEHTKGDKLYDKIKIFSSTRYARKGIIPFIEEVDI